MQLVWLRHARLAPTPSHQLPITPQMNIPTEIKHIFLAANTQK
jgi:hypothetical protein